MSLHLENSTNEANDLLQGAKLNSYLIIYIEFSTVHIIVKQQTLRKGRLDTVDLNILGWDQ